MCATPRLPSGARRTKDLFRSQEHAMEYLQRVENGRRVRTDDEIRTLIKLAAQGSGVAGTIQAALGLHALQRQLTRLFDTFSPPGEAVLDEPLLTALLKAGDVSADYVREVLPAIGNPVARKNAVGAFSTFLRRNPHVRRNGKLLSADLSMVAVFVLVGSQQMGLTPDVQPKELEALVQIAGVRYPATEFLKDPSPLANRRQNWKAMIRDITKNKLPHLRKLRIK
jgi:hypothetical protein